MGVGGYLILGPFLRDYGICDSPVQKSKINSGMHLI